MLKKRKHFALLFWLMISLAGVLIASCQAAAPPETSEVPADAELTPIDSAEPEGEFPLEPNPLTVKAAVDESGSVSIDPYSGGNLSFNGVQIVGYPPINSLYMLEGGEAGPVFETEMTMAPITSIEGLPEGAEFLAGIQLEPSGLRSADYIYLTIQLPVGTDAEGLYAFAFGSNGEDFHLVPATITEGFGDYGPSAAFALYHFSGVGLLKMDATDVYLENLGIPTTPSLQAMHLLGMLSPEDQKGPKGQWVLDRWFRRGLSPKLDAMTPCTSGGSVVTETDGLLDAAIEFMWWAETVTSLRHADALETQMTEALGKLQQMLNACLPVVCIECIDLQNAEVRSRMLSLAVISNIIQRYSPGLLAPLVAPIDWGAMTRVCYEKNGKANEFLSAVRVVADGCYDANCEMATPQPCPPIPK